MPEYTPNYRIPYPTNGDPIYQGAQQMRELARTVDATMIGVSGVEGPPGPQGPQGPQGDRGPEGPRGDRGPVGPPGPEGPQGETGKRGEKGAQGDPGSGFQLLGALPTAADLPDAGDRPGDAYLIDETADVWVWTGDEWESVGQIQGPRGKTGAKGDPGPQGPQGERGTEGPQGETGPKGDTGERGPQGPTGAQGPKGDTGERGPQGERGPKGDTETPADWSTTGITLKDNGSINLGIGGTFTYRWRVDRGLFQLYFRIRWGRSGSSGGGSVRLILPVQPATGLEAIGSATYYQVAENWSMQVAPTVGVGSNDMRFLVPRSGGDTTRRQFRIWNGSNGSGTGIPANPGYFLDGDGCSMQGNIQFPV